MSVLKPNLGLRRSTKRLHKNGVRDRASQPKPFENDISLLSDVSLADGFYLAGLIDGEGCFTIAKTGVKRADHTASWACRFTIGLRADDVLLLRGLHETFGLGVVQEFPAYKRAGRNNSPAAHWTITAKAECLSLVRILDQFPLRSKKASDYALWREAVLYWQNPPRRARVTRRTASTTRVIQAMDWTHMEELADELKAHRAFSRSDTFAARLTVPARPA